MHRNVITLFVNDPMGRRWEQNLESARMAERELGAEIVIVKKTSPDYHSEKDPPCPSVLLDARLLVSNGTITYETLQAEIRREM